MNDDRRGKGDAPLSVPGGSRADRLADALRANLRRRRAQRHESNETPSEDNEGAPNGPAPLSPQNDG